MFCQKCGTQLPDGAAFCPVCGWSAARQPQPQPLQPPKKNNTLLIVLLALVAVLFIASVALTIVLVSRDSGSSGGSSSKTEEEDNSKSESSDAASVAEAFIVGLFTDDVDAMTDQIPEELYEVMVDMGEANTVSQMKRQVKNFFQEIIDDFYDELDILYRVDPRDVKVKVSGLKKDRDETNDLKDEVIDAYADAYDVTVKDFAAYTCTLTVTVNGEKETFDDFYIPLIKLGSKWYIDAYSVNNELFEPFI